MARFGSRVVAGLKDVADSVVAGDSLWITDDTNSVFQVPLAELQP